MKPKPTKQKPIIKAQIKQFLSQFRPGDNLRTDDVVKAVRRGTGRQFYPDTCLRYMRELRQDGEINFTCVFKQDRIIQIIAPGEPHSL